MPPLLNSADNVMMGAQQVQRVYRGSTLVWENERAASISLALSVTTLDVGQSVTLTATCGAGQPADSTVKFRVGSPTGTVIATDTASPWTTTHQPAAAGVTTYYAELVENPPFVAAMSAAKSVSVYQPTSISLSGGTTIIAGNSATLTATVTGATSGSVRFRSGSTSGTIVTTVALSGATAQTSVSPSSTTTYYAEYVANGYTKGSFSGAATVTVTPLVATSISLAASPSSLIAGQSSTLTATTVNIPAGSTITFRSGSVSGTVVGTGTVSSNTATTSVTVNSSTTYYATYAGASGYLASNSGGATVTATPLVATSISLAASATTVNAGQSVTLTASTGGIPAGNTITFRSGSTSGTVVGTGVVSSNKATLSVTVNSSTTYYATFAGNAQYLPSNSGGVSVTARTLIRKTWSGKSSWAASYNGSGVKRTDTDRLYFGYYSSTWGNQRSLFGFALPSDLEGCAEIESMDLDIYIEHTYLNSGGKTNLGMHDYTSEPNSWSGSRVDEDIKDLTNLPKPGWKSTSLGSNFKPDFISGANVGFALGPGPTSSSDWYGYATGTGTNRPALSIVYYVWG